MKYQKSILLASAASLFLAVNTTGDIKNLDTFTKQAIKKAVNSISTNNDNIMNNSDIELNKAFIEYKQQNKDDAYTFNFREYKQICKKFMEIKPDLLREKKKNRVNITNKKQKNECSKLKI